MRYSVVSTRYCWLVLAVLCCSFFVLGCDDSGSSDKPAQTEMASSNTDSTGDDAEKSAASESPDESQSTTSDSSSGTVIVAVGDSLTTGQALGAENYPSRLSRILGIPVINEGRGGERTGVALNRIGSVLAKHNPDMVLIMYGTNDVLSGWPLDDARANLRSLDAAVRESGAAAFLATIPPMIGPNADLNPDVQAMNSAIRSAAGAGARLVDVAGQFGSGQGLLLPDGFHPNEPGTQVIAFAFADAIR